MSSGKYKISTLLVFILSAMLVLFACNNNPYKNLKLNLDVSEKTITLVDGTNEGDNTFSITANVTGRNKGYDGGVNFEVVGLENVIEKVHTSDISDGSTTALFHAVNSGSATIRVTTNQGNLSKDVKINVIREISSFSFTTNTIPVPREQLVDLRDYIKFNPLNTSQKNIKVELVKDGESVELNKIFNENGKIKVGSGVMLTSFDVVVSSVDKPSLETIRANVKVVDVINKDLIKIKYNNGTVETDDDTVLEYANGAFQITLAPNTSDVNEKKIYFDFNNTPELNDKYVVSVKNADIPSRYVDVDDYKDNSFMIKSVGLGKETITFKVAYKEFPNLQIFTQEIKLNVEVLTYPSSMKALNEAGNSALDSLVLYKNYASKKGTAVKGVVLDDVSELVGQKFRYSFNKEVGDKILVYRQDGTVIEPNTDILSGSVIYIKHFYNDGETLPADLKIKLTSSAYNKVFVEVPVAIETQEIHLEVESTEIKIDKNSKVITPENPHGDFGYKEIKFLNLPTNFNKMSLVVEGVNADLLSVYQTDTILGFFSKGKIGENTVRIISPNGQVLSINIIIFEALNSDSTYISIANKNIGSYVGGTEKEKVSLKNNLNIALNFVVNGVSYKQLPGGLKIQTVSNTPQYVRVNADGVTLMTRELVGSSEITVKITGFDENGQLTREITYKFDVFVQVPINSLTTGTSETSIYDLKSINDSSVNSLGSHTINLLTQPYNASYKLADMEWLFVDSFGNILTPNITETDTQIIYYMQLTDSSGGASPSVVYLTISKANIKQGVVTVNLNSSVEKLVFFVMCRIKQNYTNENGATINDFKETRVKINAQKFITVEDIILNDVAQNQAGIAELKFDSRYMGLVGDAFTKNNTKTISYNLLPTSALLKKISATSSSSALSVVVNGDNTITVTANRRNIEAFDIYITLSAVDSRNSSGLYTKYIKILVKILDGSEENPYEIGTAKELYELDDMFANYVLTNNINVNSYYNSWKPIGSTITNKTSQITPFMGKLSGQYKVKNEDGNFMVFQYGINGLNFKNDETTFGHTYVGLFAYLGSTAVVENLTINNITFQFNDLSSNQNNIYIGAIAGYSEGKIINCSVNDGNGIEKFTGQEIDGLNMNAKGIWISGTTQNQKYIFAGGLVGFLNNAQTGVASAQIENSTANILINSIGAALNNFIGGMVGYNNKAIITKSISSEINFGYSNSDAIVAINPYSQATNYTDASSFGGVVGYNNGTILNVSARAVIYGNKNIGGIAGTNSGTIQNTTAMPVLRGKQYIGGLIGNNKDVVNNIKISYTELVGSSTVTINKNYTNKGIEANMAFRDPKFKIESLTRDKFVENGNDIDNYSYNIVESNKVEFVLFEAKETTSSMLDKVSQYNTAIIGENYIGGLIGYQESVYDTTGSIILSESKALTENSLSINFRSSVQYNSVYSYLPQNTITNSNEDTTHDILDENSSLYLSRAYYGDVVLKNTHLNEAYTDVAEGNANRNYAGGLFGYVKNGYVNNLNANVIMQAHGAILGGVVGLAEGYYVNKDVSLAGSLINRKISNVETATGNFIGDASKLNSNTEIKTDEKKQKYHDTYSITTTDEGYSATAPDNKNPKFYYGLSTVSLNNEKISSFYNIITSYSLMNVTDSSYITTQTDSVSGESVTKIPHGFVGIGEKSIKKLAASYPSNNDRLTYDFERELENVLTLNSFYLNLEEDLYFKWERTQGNNPSEDVYAKYNGILQENADVNVGGVVSNLTGKSVFSTENIAYLSSMSKTNKEVIDFYHDSNAAALSAEVTFNLFDTMFKLKDFGVGVGIKLAKTDDVNTPDDDYIFNEADFPNFDKPLHYTAMEFPEFIYSNVAKYGVQEKNMGDTYLFKNIEYSTYYYNETKDTDPPNINSNNGINNDDETSDFTLQTTLGDKNWYSNDSVTSGLPILLNKDRYISEDGYHRINLIYNYPPSEIILSLKDNKETTWIYQVAGKDGLIIYQYGLDASNYINGSNIINFGNNNAGLSQSQISDYTANVNSQLFNLNTYDINSIMDLKTIPAFLGVTNLKISSSNKNIISVENINGQLKLVANGTGKATIYVSSIYNPSLMVEAEINVVKAINTLSIQQTINGNVNNFENNHTVNLTKSTSSKETSVVLRGSALGQHVFNNIPTSKNMKLTGNVSSGVRYYFLNDKTFANFETKTDNEKTINSIYWSDQDIALNTYLNMPIKINGLTPQVESFGADRNLVYVDVITGVDTIITGSAKAVQSVVAVPYVIDGENKVVLGEFLNQDSSNNLVPNKSIFANQNSENVYVFGLAKSESVKLFNVNVLNGTHELNIEGDSISFEPQNTRNFQVSIKTDNLCTENKQNADGSLNPKYFVDESLYLNYLDASSKTLNVDKLFLKGSGSVKIGKVTLSINSITRDAITGTKTYNFMLEVKDEDKLDENLDTITEGFAFDLNYFTAKIDANINEASDGIHIINTDISSIMEYNKSLSVVLNPQPVKSVDIKHYPNAEYEIITDDSGKEVGGKIDLTEVAYNNIIPGRVGVLKINVAPYFSKFNYIEILSSGSGENIVSFEQVLANYTVDNGYKVFNGTYTTRGTSGEIIPGKNGIKLLKMSNVSDNGGIDFDGNIYVKTLINSRVSEATVFTLTADIYSKVNDVVTKERSASIDLFVISPPGLELIYETDNGKPVIARGTSIKFKAKLTAITGEIDFTESHITAGANTNLGGYGSAFVITSLGNNEYSLECGINIRQGYNIRVIGKINKTINNEVYRNKDEINFKVANFVVHEVGVKNVVNGNFQGRFYQSYPLIVQFTNVSYNDKLVGVEQEIRELEIELSVGKYADKDTYSTWYQVVKQPNGSSNYTSLKTTSNFVIYETSLGHDYDDRIGYTLQNVVYNSGDRLAAVVKIVYGENGAMPAQVNYNNGNPGVDTGGEDFNPNYFMEMECEFGFGFYRLSNEKQPEPITSVQDLINMQSGTDYILLNDLTLYNWEPLPETLTINSLDGNGYVINIKSFKTATEPVINGNIGLFSKISSSTTIKNLIIQIEPDNQNVDISDEAIKSVDNDKADLLINATAYQNVNFGILAGVNEGIVTNSAVVYDSGLLRLERDILLISKTKFADSNYKQYFDEGKFNALKFALNNFEVYFPNKLLINKDITKFDNVNEFVSSSNTIYVSGKRRDLSIVKINTDTTTTSHIHNMGGLVGINNGFITNSRVDNISINGIGYVAGLVAQNTNKISSSYFKGGNIQNRASAKIIDSSGTGGLVAVNGSEGEVQYSYVLGREGDGNNFQIGISYYRNEEDKNITHAITTPINYSDKTGISSLIINGTSNKHQFAGHKYNIIQNTGTADEKKAYSYEVGALRAMNSAISASSDVGAFVYQNDGLINNSYSNILVNTSAKSSGFVYQNNLNASISDSYSLSSTIISSTTHSPFVGRDNNNNYNNKGTISYSQYLKLGSGDNDSALELKYADIFLDDNEPATKLSASQFKEYNTFQGFAFNSDFNKNDDITRSVWFIPNGTEATKNESSKISVLQNKFYSDFYIQNRPELVAANIKTVSIRVLSSNASSSEENNYDYISKEIGSSEQNPFLIRTAEEFNMYVTETVVKSDNENINDSKTQSSSIRFVSDIIFNNEDLKAVTYNIDYVGDLDGNGMDINELRLISDSDFEGTNKETLKLGMFGSITSKVKQRGIVRNLNINVAEVRGTNVHYVGTLAGIVDNGSAFNINVKGNEVVQGKHVVGGVFGLVTGESEIVNITSSVSAQATYYKNANTYNANNNYIKPKGFEILNVDESKQTYISNIKTISYAGGVAGVINVDKRKESEMSKTSIRNARARKIVVNGNVTITGEIVGGIFGYVGKNSTVSDLTFEIQSNASKSVLKASRIAGGIVGENRGRIERSYIAHSSAVQAEIDAEARTLVGDYYSSASYEVKNSSKNYNGLFASGNAHYIGGAVGLNNGGIIINSYSKVNVININAMIGGGFIGASIGGEVKYSYTTGSVSAFKVVGGFIGVQFTNQLVAQNGQDFDYVNEITENIPGSDKTITHGDLFEGNLFFDLPSDHFVLSNLNSNKPTDLYQVVSSNIWRKEDTFTSREKYVADDVRFGALIGELDQHKTDLNGKQYYNIERSIKMPGIETRQKQDNNFFVQPFLNVTSGKPTIMGTTETDWRKLAQEIGYVNGVSVLTGDNYIDTYKNGVYDKKVPTVTNSVFGDGDLRINKNVTLVTDEMGGTITTNVIEFMGKSGIKDTTVDGITEFIVYSRLQNIGSARTLKEIIERRYLYAEGVYMNGGVKSEGITTGDNLMYPKIYHSWSNTLWAGIDLSGSLNETNNATVELDRKELVFPKLEIKPETSIIYVTKASDLLLMNKYPNADFVLMNDVNMEDGTISEYATTGWVPVGNSSVPFTGRLYSQYDSAKEKYNNYTISNLVIKTSNDAYVGFVGFTKESNFHDFTLTVKSIETPNTTEEPGKEVYYHIGTIYGYNDISCIVENITVKSATEKNFTITGNKVASIGGIAGTSLNSTFNNCEVNGANINVITLANKSNASADLGNIGGIAGRISSREDKLGESYTGQNLRVVNTTITLGKSSDKPLIIGSESEATGLQIGGVFGAVSNTPSYPVTLAGLQINDKSKINAYIQKGNTIFTNLYVGGLVGNGLNVSMNNKIMMFDKDGDITTPSYVKNSTQGEVNVETTNYNGSLFIGGAFGNMNAHSTGSEFGDAKNIEVNTIVSYLKKGNHADGITSKSSSYFGNVFGRITGANVGNIILTETSKLTVSTFDATDTIDYDNIYYGGIAGEASGIRESDFLVSHGVINVGVVNTNKNLKGNNTFVGGVYGAYSGDLIQTQNGINYATSNAKIHVNSLNKTNKAPHYIGGLVGYGTNGRIKQSISNSEICIYNKDNKGAIYVGGMLGFATGTNTESKDSPIEIENSYSAGHVELTNGIKNGVPDADPIYFGGFVGVINYTTNAETKANLINLQNNYSITKLIYDVNGKANYDTYIESKYKGGFVGSIIENFTKNKTVQPIKFVNNYYNQDLVPYGANNAQGLSTHEMMFNNENTYNGFDKTNIWNIGVNKYPTLKWAANSLEPVNDDDNNIATLSNNIVKFDNVKYAQILGTHQNPYQITSNKTLADIQGVNVATASLENSSYVVSSLGGTLGNLDVENLTLNNANVYYNVTSGNFKTFKEINKYSLVYGLKISGGETDKCFVKTNNGLLINTQVDLTGGNDLINKVQINNGVINYMPIKYTTEKVPNMLVAVPQNYGIIDKLGVDFIGSTVTSGSIYAVGSDYAGSKLINSYIKNNVPDTVENTMTSWLVQTWSGNSINNSYERRESFRGEIPGSTDKTIYKYFDANKGVSYISYNMEGTGSDAYKNKDTNINALPSYVDGKYFNFENVWTYQKNSYPRLQWEFKNYYLDKNMKAENYWENGNEIITNINPLNAFRAKAEELNASKILNISGTNEEKAKTFGLMSYMASTGLQINKGVAVNNNNNLVNSYALRSKTKPKIDYANNILVLSHVAEGASAVSHIDLNKNANASVNPSYNKDEATTKELSGVVYITTVVIINGQLNYETRMYYNFMGVTVNLTGEVDLTGKLSNPIGFGYDGIDFNYIYDNQVVTDKDYFKKHELLFSQNNTNAFSGVFNGNDHDIIGLNIITNRNAGLFGTVDFTTNTSSTVKESSPIRNVRLRDGNVICTNKYGSSGGVVGVLLADGSNTQHIFNRVAVESVDVSARLYAGGIYGTNHTTKESPTGKIIISETYYSHGFVTSETGGFTSGYGYNRNGLIELGDTYFSGNIKTQKTNATDTLKTRKSCVFVGGGDGAVSLITNKVNYVVGLKEDYPLEGNNENVISYIDEYTFKYKNINKFITSSVNDIWSRNSAKNKGYPILQRQVDYWVNHQEAVTEGTGASAKTYTITNAKQLAWVAAQVNEGSNDFSGKTIIIGKDIDLTGKMWNPIGYKKDFSTTGANDRPFRGKITAKKDDATNYKIYNLTTSGRYNTETTDGVTVNTLVDVDCQGLFGHTNNAVIENVELVNKKYSKETTYGFIFGQHFIGGLVGFAQDTVITNCTNENFVSGTSNIGGIAGRIVGVYNANTSISNSINSGVIYGSNNLVGGIAGITGDGVDEVFSLTTGNKQKQGEKPVKLINNINKISTIDSKYSVTGNSYVGGITGKLSKNSIIDGAGNYVYNAGSLGGNRGGKNGYDNSGKTSGKQKVGGIVGVNCGEVTNVTNTGDVVGIISGINPEVGQLGGIVGLNNGDVYEVINIGNLTSTHNNVGGIVGYNEDYEETITKDRKYTQIVNALNLAETITGNSGTIGGIVGDFSRGGTSVSPKHSLSSANIKNCISTTPRVFAVAGGVNFDDNINDIYNSVVSDEEKTKMDYTYLNYSNSVTTTLSTLFTESNSNVWKITNGFSRDSFKLDYKNTNLDKTIFKSISNSDAGATATYDFAGTNMEINNAAYENINRFIKTRPNLNYSLYIASGTTISTATGSLGNIAYPFVGKATKASGTGNANLTIIGGNTLFNYANKLGNGEASSFSNLNIKVNEKFNDDVLINRGIKIDVNNVTLSGSGNVNSDETVGGLIGQAINSKLENVTNSISVTASGDYAGGIIGWGSNVEMKTCTNDAVVKGKTSVGGLIGYATNSLIDNNCRNLKEISGTENIGGIAGFISSSNSLNKGILNAVNEKNISGSGNNIGGIVGRGLESNIGNVQNKGNVNGISMIGGIIGYSDACNIISNLEISNNGRVDAYSYAGGVAGYTTGSSEISSGTSTNFKVINTGIVIATENNSGGITGYLSPNSTITYAKNNSVIKAPHYIGGIAGESAGIISYCENGDKGYVESTYKLTNGCGGIAGTQTAGNINNSTNLGKVLYLNYTKVAVSYEDGYINRNVRSVFIATGGEDPDYVINNFDINDVKNKMKYFPQNNMSLHSANNITYKNTNFYYGKIIGSYYGGTNNDKNNASGELVEFSKLSTYYTIETQGYGTPVPPWWGTSWYYRVNIRRDYSKTDLAIGGQTLSETDESYIACDRVQLGNAHASLVSKNWADRTYEVDREKDLYGFEKQIDDPTQSYYKINLVLNGGTIAGGNTVIKLIQGLELGSLPAATKSGFELEGWSLTNSDVSENIEFPLAVVGDITVYAKWVKAATTTVIYKSQIDVEISRSEFPRNTEIETLKDGVVLNKNFKGWYSQKRIDYLADLAKKGVKEGDKYIDSGYEYQYTYANDCLIEPNGVNCFNGDYLTLYAYYTVEVTFADKDNNVLSTQTIDEFSKATKPADPVLDKNTFIGWFTDTTFENEFMFNETVITQNTTIYAKFISNEHKVTFDPNGGELGGSTANKEVLILNNGTIGNGYVPTRQHYTFAGWFEEIDERVYKEFKTTDKVTKNLTLFAKWIPNEYVITVKDEATDAEVKNFNITYGVDVIDPTAITAPNGKYIVGFFTNKACTTVYDVNSRTPNGSITIYVKFANFLDAEGKPIPPHTVTLKGVAGTSSITVPSGSYIYSNPVIVENVKKGKFYLSTKPVTTRVVSKFGNEVENANLGEIVWETVEFNLYNKISCNVTLYFKEAKSEAEKAKIVTVRNNIDSFIKQYPYYSGQLANLNFIKSNIETPYLYQGGNDFAGKITLNENLYTDDSYSTLCTDFEVKANTDIYAKWDYAEDLKLHKVNVREETISGKVIGWVMMPEMTALTCNMILNSFGYSSDSHKVLNADGTEYSDGLWYITNELTMLIAKK